MERGLTSADVGGLMMPWNQKKFFMVALEAILDDALITLL